MGGSGDVVYMRGIAGAAADDDRDAGFQRALDENPDINVVFESHTNWDQATGTQQFTDFLGTVTNYDGIWTSGIDNVIVQAMLDNGEELFRSSVRTTPASSSSCWRSMGSSVPPSRTPPPSVARRHARAADPQRRGAGGEGHADGAADLGERHRGGHRPARGGQRSGHRSELAAAVHPRGVDRLLEGRDRRLRRAVAPDEGARRGRRRCRRPAPCHPPRKGGDDRAPARGHRHREALRAGPRCATHRSPCDPARSTPWARTEPARAPWSRS